MTRRRLVLVVLTSVLLLGSMGASSLTYWVAGAGGISAPVTILAVPEDPSSSADGGVGAELTVMSLNAAHGGGGGVAQILRDGQDIRSTVRKLGRFIRQHQPEVVALQEADGPSAWSGNFNHVLSLARRAELTHAALGPHIDGLKLRYGTALLGRSLSDARSHTFSPAPPLFTKGYLSARVPWESVEGGAIRVISVHLDFLRRAVRHGQVEEMVRSLSRVEEPMVVLGDFNCGWEGGRSAVAELARRLGLQAYRPDAEDLDTFPSTNKRLDWVLISPELRFLSYRVQPCDLTDHAAVIARLGVGPAHGEKALRR